MLHVVGMKLALFGHGPRCLASWSRQPRRDSLSLKHTFQTSNGGFPMSRGTSHSHLPAAGLVVTAFLGLPLLACNDYGFSHSESEKPGDTALPSDKPIPEEVQDSGGSAPPTDSGEPDLDDCEDGYWADYFNLPADHPEVEIDISGLVPGDSPFNHDWYDAQYFSFRQVDPGLEFGENWWPVDEGLEGDPQYFAVHWKAWLDVHESAPVTFELGSDDDGWAFIDGEMVADLGGIHGVEETSFLVTMEQGIHELDLYMAERHTSNSGFWFRWLEDTLEIYACPQE